MYLANDEQMLGESTGVNAGATGPWCWINTNNADRKVILWQVLAGKGWEILCYIVTVALYILVKCHMVGYGTLVGLSKVSIHMYMYETDHRQSLQIIGGGTHTPFETAWREYHPLITKFVYVIMIILCSL